MKGPGDALVIGAGLAGCSVAAALARRGFRVGVIGGAEPAASAIPVAVLAPPPVPGNDPVTALRRRGARVTAAWCHRLEAATGDCGRLGRGVLLLPHRERDRARFARLPRRGAGPVRVDPAAAAELGGIEVGDDCVHHPGGGWFDPAGLCRALLSRAGIPAPLAARVAGLEYRAGRWSARDAQGGELARAPLVVVAAGIGSARLLPGLPLVPARGQATAIAATGPVAGLRLAVSGGGYAVPGPDGRAWLGATLQRGTADAAPRSDDDTRNRALAARLWPGVGMPPTEGAFAAVRATTRDRLPLVGPVAPGLWCATGHGTQGLATAPLSALLLADAIARGGPSPLLRRLDPYRAAAGGRGAALAHPWRRASGAPVTPAAHWEIPA